MGEVTITLRLTKYPTRGGRLNYDPREILDRVARVLQRSTRDAFRSQRYGKWRWPEVYEGSKGPFINVAGALVDFNEGASAPRTRQFQRRPALIDSGDLRASVHTRATGPLTLEQWSTRSDARAHMDGQPVVIPVTEQAKRGIASWLFEQGNTDYTPKLNHLLKKEKYIVKLHPRPFMGMTDDLKMELEDAITRFFRGRVEVVIRGI